MLKDKILVLMGGYSEEREVSLRSGAAVLNALKNLDYDAAALDLKGTSVQAIADYNPDLVFIALHGKDGEDGTVQGLLEIMGIPYTGSGVASSAIGMNKVLTKKILMYEGIPTAAFAILKRSLTSPERELQSLLKNIGLPMVIKAATQGSSIGTFIVRQEKDVLEAIEAAFQYDSEVVVEKFIDGIEVTSTVIGNDFTQVLPLIEITSANEFYDYESKYTPGKCNHIIPARIPEELQEKIAKLSERVYQAIGCTGYSRVDFIIDKDGNPFVLEINTLPGLTEMSLVPDAARAAGISFEELVDKIVGLGLEKPVRQR
ncbi:MAG: D-alanine--D-alanine ligase [Syntrophomonas sp.]|nr:D-alanine--D-alanine ligase [Syntrophomonas sp.]